MEGRETLLKEYEQALQAEREWWALVKGTSPGSPGYSAVAWKEWYAAAERTNLAAKALREASN